MDKEQELVFNEFLALSNEYDFSDVLSELAFLPMTGGKIKYKNVATAWESLSEIKKIQVVNEICKWHLDRLEEDK